MPADALDILHTAFITLAQAAKFFPSNRTQDKHINFKVLYRWIHQGLPDGNGNRVKLQARKVSGTLYTTVEWVNEFLAQTAIIPVKPEAKAEATLTQAGI